MPIIYLDCSDRAPRIHHTDHVFYLENVAAPHLPTLLSRLDNICVAGLLPRILPRDYYLVASSLVLR